MPVAVRVPDGVPVEIAMIEDNWAFGRITGEPTLLPAFGSGPRKD